MFIVIFFENALIKITDSILIIGNVFPNRAIGAVICMQIIQALIKQLFSDVIFSNFILIYDILIYVAWLKLLRFREN